MYIFLYLVYWNCIYMVETIIISTVVVKELTYKLCKFVWPYILCVCVVLDLHSKEQLGPIIYRNIL